MILEPLYLYCERSGPGLWEEPLNLLASLVFVPVFWAIWRISHGFRPLRVMAILSLLLTPISILVHTVPSLLTAIPVVGMILAIFLINFYLANRHIIGLSQVQSVIFTLLILPFAGASLSLLTLVRGAQASLAFLALPILILGYSAMARQERPQTARGLLIAAAILGVGIGFRTIDLPLCGSWPHGTQFLWKLSVAVFLVHMSYLYRAHVLAGPGGDG